MKKRCGYPQTSSWVVCRPSEIRFKAGQNSLLRRHKARRCTSHRNKLNNGGEFNVDTYLLQWRA